MNILIHQVEYRGMPVDILISGNRIARVAAHIDATADKVIEGAGKAVAPGFVNMHTHVPMTLFRGFADDMELMPWLTQKIWPHEAKMTDEMYYWGARLACLEMIRTGTTCFNDQYMNLPVVAKAAQDSGLRGFIAGLVMDPSMKMTAEEARAKMDADMAHAGEFGPRVTLTIGAHAIYTVPEPVLRAVAAYALEHHLLIHMHANETEKEVNDCLEQHGMRPIEWLDSIGFLGENVIFAHALWLSDHEIQLMADHGASAVHNPASNLKLASGYQFRYEEMRAKGVRIGLGTDGNSSSNNLDMVEAMRIASLMGKAWRFDPTAVRAQDIFHTATRGGAEILGIPAGKVEEGFLADLVLYDLQTPAFVPNFNFVSNLVYSANGYHADTVICDGRILMENGHVAGEEEIMRKVREVTAELFA